MEKKKILINKDCIDKIILGLKSIKVSTTNKRCGKITGFIEKRIK